MDRRFWAFVTSHSKPDSSSGRWCGNIAWDACILEQSSFKSWLLHFWSSSLLNASWEVEDNGPVLGLLISAWPSSGYFRHLEAWTRRWKIFGCSALKICCTNTNSFVELETKRVVPWAGCNWTGPGVWLAHRTDAWRRLISAWRRGGPASLPPAEPRWPLVGPVRKPELV